MSSDLEVPDSVLNCSEYIPQRVCWIVSQHENLHSSQRAAPWSHQNLGLSPAIAPTIHCRVHEDNASALLLANSQHLNNRNKYLAAKLDHFWSHVKPGVVKVVKCDTKLMLADTFTKSLAREVFQRLRLMIMGWSSLCACGEMRFGVKELWTFYTYVQLYLCPPASTAKVGKDCYYVEVRYCVKWKGESESQSFESIGRFVRRSRSCFGTRETKTKYALFVLIARQVHESIERSTPLLNFVVIFVIPVCYYFSTPRWNNWTLATYKKQIVVEIFICCWPKKVNVSSVWVRIVLANLVSLNS